MHRYEHDVPGVVPHTINRFSGQWAWLSNFHVSPFEFEIPRLGIAPAEVPTVEHAYQACKCTTRLDALDILTAATPGQAKRLGRIAPLRPGWNELRIRVMRDLLTLKFERGSELGRQLLRTGDARLVEGNTWGDRFWGVCDGRGENYLGLLLEMRRAWLRA